MTGKVLRTMVGGRTVYQYAIERARSVGMPDRGKLIAWPCAACPAGLLLLGYLLGSIPFGLILTRLAGLGDIRAIGSGNIGATNVLRTGRKGLAAATLLLDALKGTAAVLIGWRYGAATARSPPASAPIVGHCFPVWLKFKGGKGVATFLGVLLGLHWPTMVVDRAGLARHRRGDTLLVALRARREPGRSDRPVCSSANTQSPASQR